MDVEQVYTMTCRMLDRREVEITEARKAEVYESIDFWIMYADELSLAEMVRLIVSEVLEPILSK